MKGILFGSVLGSLLPSRPKGTDLVPQTNDALFALWSLLTLGQMKRGCREVKKEYCWYVVNRKCDWWGCKNHYDRVCNTETKTVCND